MDEIPVTQARAQLSELILRVEYRGDRILLTRHNKPVAALVPVDDAFAASPDLHSSSGGSLHTITSTAAPSDLGFAARDDH